MLIQKARAVDFARIRSLAAKYNLDYADMEENDFWVAAEGQRIVGICGLKKHPDCLELCALGVAGPYRNRGLGRKLVSALLEDSAGVVYLTTIIPGFFEKLGFVRADRILPSMVKPEEWCAGCRRDGCRVMVKKR